MRIKDKPVELKSSVGTVGWLYYLGQITVDGESRMLFTFRHSSAKVSDGVGIMHQVFHTVRDAWTLEVQDAGMGGIVFQVARDSAPDQPEVDDFASRIKQAIDRSADEEY